MRRKILDKLDKPIIDHYIRFWKKPDSIYSSGLRQDLPPGPISVAEFSPSSQDQDWTYATIGASRHPMPYPTNWKAEKPERRVELFIYSNKKNEDLSELLIKLAKYPFYNKTFLDRTHTIPGESGIVKGSSMTDILLLRPYFEQEEFEIIHLNEFHHVRMLWIIPIYRSERKFIQKHKIDVFEELLHQTEPNTSDFLRPPII
jgi:hypothetical protein